MEKTVLITGAGGLIGAELCMEFLSQGYHVIALDRKSPQIKHANLSFEKCDLSSEKDILKVAKKVSSLHVLIHNAARTDLMFKDFSEFSLNDWNEALKVNLTSNFLLSQKLMPLLRKSKGSIINISSSRHLQSEKNTEVYSATKGAVTSLTHAMAVTQQHYVRVNSISPGWIADPAKKSSKKDKDQHLVGRVGIPADIAKLALYLASDEAGFITGQDFVVDGGMTKKMIYV